MFKKILLPTDGSPIATSAARAGLALAKKLGAKVVCCSVYEELRPVFSPRSGVNQSMVDEYNVRAAEAGQKNVDAVAKLAARLGVDFTPVVTPDQPPHLGILGVAAKRKCDVIFMASHGRSGLDKLMMGSVTQKVLAAATVPVVIYR